MFNSTGNNFGAGQITFKDYQASNYVVLNSKFTFDPTNADYQACDQLEIYVPDLTIDRSAVGGVFIRFVEDYHYSWGGSVYDGGTVLKSWIKDKNTIVIEKQPWFDENGPLIIYIVTLYPQLNQGGNTIKSTMQRLTMTTEGNYLRFDYETFMCEFEHRRITSPPGAGSTRGRTPTSTTEAGLNEYINATDQVAKNQEYN